MKNLMIPVYFLIGVALFILFSKNSGSDNLYLHLINRYNLDERDGIIIVRGDARSHTHRKFVKRVDRFLQENGLNFSFLVSRTSKRAFGSLSQNALQVEVTEFKVPQRVWLVDKSGELIIEKSLMMPVEHFIQNLNGYLGKVDGVDLNIEVGEDLSETPLKMLSPYCTKQKATVFLIFESLCINCASGKALTRLDFVLNRYESYEGLVVVREDYGAEEIASFLEDHGIYTPVVMPKNGFEELWVSLEEPLPQKHILDQMVLIVGEDEKILHVSALKRWGDVDQLLAEHSL